MVRVGIVGCGNTIGISKQHIKGYLLQDNAKITALYDILDGRAEALKEQFKLSEAIVCKSYEQLLDNVDAVSICTPNVTHTPLVVEALKRGKHVLCEKPFARNSEECMDSIRYERLAGKVCMIGLCYRGIPAFRYMKKLLDEGFLGQIYYVREAQGGGRIGNPDVKCEWRMQEELSGPGSVADFGSHMLDMTDWLLRPLTGPITEVQCMEGTFIKERQEVFSSRMKAVNNDDVAVFNARMESGALVSFTSSRIGCDHLLEIYGSGGYLGFNGNNQFALTIQKNGGKRETVPVPEELYKINDKVPCTPFDVNFYFEMKEFIDAIENKTEVSTGFARGLYIQRLIDALQHSSDVGAAVKIDFVDQE